MKKLNPIKKAFVTGMALLYLGLGSLQAGIKPVPKEDSKKQTAWQIHRIDPKDIPPINHAPYLNQPVTPNVLEHIDTLKSLKDKDGVLVFYPSEKVYEFMNKGGNASYAVEILSKIKKQTEYDSKDIESYLNKCLDSEVDLRYFYALTDMEDKTGRKLVSVGAVPRLKKYNKTPEQIKKSLEELAKIKHPTKKGEKFFEPWITAYNSTNKMMLSGKGRKYVKKMLKLDKTLPTDLISRYALFDIGVKDLHKFKNTEKPNALFVQAWSDDNSSMSNHQSINFFNNLKKEYDVYFEIYHREERLFNLIDQIPAIDLLIINGHGSQLDQTIVDTNLFMVESKDKEVYEIDMSDKKELKQYLAKLNPNAVIFLKSCSNAKGGADAENLANMFIEAGNGRTVYASKAPFNANDMKVNSYYPLSLEIVKKGKNLTYTNNE